MSEKKEYPYTAYMLTPACKVKEVSVAGEYCIDGYLKLRGGDAFKSELIHDTPRKALLAGLLKIGARRESLEKQLETADKREQEIHKQLKKLEEGAK